jgi:hypothetical protein
MSARFKYIRNKVSAGIKYVTNKLDLQVLTLIINKLSQSI